MAQFLEKPGWNIHLPFRLRGATVYFPPHVIEDRAINLKNRLEAHFTDANVTMCVYPWLGENSKQNILPLKRSNTTAITHDYAFKSYTCYSVPSTRSTLILSTFYVFLFCVFQCFVDAFLSPILKWACSRMNVCVCVCVCSFSAFCFFSVLRIRLSGSLQAWSALPPPQIWEMLWSDLRNVVECFQDALNKQYTKHTGFL